MSPAVSQKPFNEETDIFEDTIEDTSKPRSKPMPNFITVGLQRKASPLSFKSWSKLAMTLDGRDKITKLLQYISRFLGWYLVGKSKTDAMRFTELYRKFAQSRKAFRMGRSFMEAEKLYEMGLGNLFVWHLKNSINDTHTPRPKVLAHQASSNIGYNPVEQEEADDAAPVPVKRRTFVRSMSNHAYHVVYKPVVSRVSSFFGETGSKEPSSDFVKAIGSAVKLLGLLGFWAGDNVNFIASTGALDDYNLPQDTRLAQRKQLMKVAGETANQAYFTGAIGGFVANLYAYISFCRGSLAKAKADVEEAKDAEEEDQEQALLKLKKLQEKQFTLLLAFVKSCCDIIVFSNNPGIDLHKKYRGKKNHEGFHCLCGFISASTVIYNFFPDDK